MVELDIEKDGADMQRLLGQKTGRRTVPNVLVDGVSIGGGDDVQSLFESGSLPTRLLQLGHGKVHKIRPTTDG